MFFGLYDSETGIIRKCLTGPSAEWAAMNALEGEQVIESATEIDDSTQKVDVTQDPPVLVDYARPLDQAYLPVAVNRERDRRLKAGKTFDGIYVTGEDRDISNLTNLALAAQLRISMGDSTETKFRDGNNVDHMLTPAAMLSLWQQASSYVSALYDASWTLKAMTPIPQDVTNDSYWP